MNPTRNIAPCDALPSTHADAREIRLRFRWIAPLYFGLLVLAVFGNGLFAASGRIFSATCHDLSLAYVAYLKFGFGEMAAGRIPLWNPHSFCGLPFVGNIQSALFYPPNWLHLLLSTSAAINWSIALHFFLAGWFTSLWCRRRGLSALACLLAGTIFMFSAGFFLHLYPGHITILGAMAWAPLLFLIVDAIFESPSLRWALAGMAVVAMSILAGHPQMVYYTALAAGLYSLLNLGACRHRIKALGCLAAIYIGAIMLSAIQLLPTAQQTAESSRGAGVSYLYASWGSTPPEALASLVSPDIFGVPLEFSPDGRQIIPPDGPGRFGYVGRVSAAYWEVLLYCGAGALALALYGALRGQRQHLRHSRIIALAMLVLAMGAYTPIFRPLFDYFPGYGSFRVTGRFNFLFSLHLAMLAAAGLDTLTRQARKMDWSVLFILLLAAAVVIGGWAIRPTESRPNESLWAWQLSTASLVPTEQISSTAIIQTGRQASNAIMLGGVIMLVMAAALLAAIRQPRWRLAAAGIAMGELVLFAVFNTPASPELLPMPTAWREGITSRPAGSRVLTSRLTHANTGMIEGYDDIHGYDPVVPRRYLELYATLIGADPNSNAMPGVPADLSPLFRMLRLGIFLRQDDDARAWTEPPAASPLPHALLVPSALVISNRDDRLQVLRNPGFDPTARVILEEPPELPLPGGTPGGTATVIPHGTDELEITATTAHPAVLLITDTYSKYWKAEGYPDSLQRAYRVQPANHALRAIVLPAGTHHIRMYFAPGGFAVGRAITLGGLVIYLVTAGWVFARRKKSRAA